MSKIEDMLARSELCLSCARLARDGTLKPVYLRLSEEWRDLAAMHVRHLRWHPDASYGRFRLDESGHDV